MNILNAILGLNRNEMKLYEDDVGEIQPGPPMGFDSDAYERHVGPFMKTAMQKTADRFGKGDLGDYANSVIRENGYRMEPVEGVTGVDEYGMSGSNLGVTRFDLKRVFAPAYLKFAFRPFYNYIVGHEAVVEVQNGSPMDAYTHAMREMEYMEDLRKNNHMKEFLAGLAMHKLRYETNPEPFEAIRDYVEAKAEEYTSGPHARKFQKYMKRIEKLMDRGYVGQDTEDRDGFREYFRMGKDVAENGLWKTMKDLAAGELDRFSAKYKPAIGEVN